MIPDPLEHVQRTLHELTETLRHRRTTLSQEEARRLSEAVAKLEVTIHSLRGEEDSSSRPDIQQSPPLEPESPLSLPPSYDLLNILPEGHVVTSPQGLIQMANPHAAQLFNLSQQELIGLSMMQFLAEQDRPTIQGRLRALQQEGTSWEWQMPYVPSHQNARLLSCTISALNDPQGRLVAVHWLLRDRTEKHHTRMAETLTQDIEEQILAGLTLPQALSLICQRLVETFTYPLVWVGAKNQDGAIRILAQAGTQGHFLAFHREWWNHGPGPLEASGTAIMEKRTQRLHPGDPLWESWVKSVRSYGFQSLLAVPLMVRQQVLGVLTVYGNQPHAFDGVTIPWLEKLAGQISLTMSMAKEFDHLRLQGAAMSSTDHAVCITDRQGRIEWVNEAYIKMTGYPATHLIGSILPVFQSGELARLVKQPSQTLPQGQCWKRESTAQRQDGQRYTVEQVMTPLVTDEGHVTHFVAVHQDITARKDAEAKIIHLAHHDPLTDLPNRIMFHDRLLQALAQARRHRKLVGVLFLDLDHFKAVNDTFGHVVGDKLLQVVASRLTDCVRTTDTVARISGDEFTLILQDLEETRDAEHVAQKVLKCLAQPIQIGAQRLSPRCSIGIALYPQDATEPETLLHQADRAMYRAKEMKEPRWQFASATYTASST